jgi:hypothetical protein
MQKIRTAVAQLLGHKIIVELGGHLCLIGLDTTHEVRLSDTHLSHQLGQRALELSTNGHFLALGDSLKEQKGQ